MTKIKQPKRLETIALQQSAYWLCLLSDEIMLKISNIAKPDPKTSTNFLKNIVKQLQNLYEISVPIYLFDKLSIEIFTTVPNYIKRIKQSIEFGNTMSQFINQINIIVALTEILVSPKLLSISFEQMPKMIRHLFYSKLNCMTGLQFLNLGSLSGGWKTDDMEPTILNGIVTLKNLQVFILNYDCTDNILLLLSQSCPKLHTVDISSSKSISNDSIDILVEFKFLKSVQLYRTSVTADGYINLLLNSMYLEDIGRYDELGRCLEYLHAQYPNKKTLNLRRFVSRFVTSRHLQLLNEKCPEIHTVSIFHNPLLNDLMQLIGINKLNDLKLMACDFFGDQIRNVLEVKGCNITHLHLEHVDEIDMNALMYISQFCPDLKVLVIYNCDLIDSTSLYTKRLEIPPYMNLERLTLAAHCKFEHIDFLLGTAYKIKFIQFGTVVPTNDFLVTRILTKNPLEYLEELRIVFSNELSIVSAYNLIEKCENLKILTEIESWNQVKPLELETFKLFISVKNLEIDITPLRKFDV